MTTPPTTPTENDESQENLGNGRKGYVNTSEQEGILRNYTKNAIKDPEMTRAIQEYYGDKNKDKLRKTYEKFMLKMPAGTRQQLDIAKGDGGLKDFLSSSGAFKHQFLYEVEKNHKLKAETKVKIVEDCVERANEEYGLTADQRQKLEEKLHKDDFVSLRSFMEYYKIRRKRINEYCGTVTKKPLDSHLNFADIHQRIANITPGTKNRADIINAWNSLMGGLDPQENETLADAIARLGEESGTAKLATSYEAFFRDCPESIITAEEKKHIRNYLLRRFLPYVTLDELEKIDPETAKALVKSNEETTAVTDNSISPEWQEIHTSRQKENSVTIQRNIFNKSAISTRKLPEDIQLKLLSAYAHVKRGSDIAQYWTGVPDGIKHDDKYLENFLDIYHFHPEILHTQEGLTKKLSDSLKEKIINIEHFQVGNLIASNLKNPDGSTMTGYYMIDEILADNDENDDNEGDGLVRLRYVGHNQPMMDELAGEKRVSKFSLYAGKPMIMNGPDCFDYFSNITSGEDTLEFIDHEAIDERLKKDGVTMYSEKDAFKKLQESHGETNFPDEDTFLKEVDDLLHDGDNKEKESSDENDRKLRPGLNFATMLDGKITTFQVESIGDGEITLWDGYGQKTKDPSKDKSRTTLSFNGFMNLIKQKKKNQTLFYRLPSKSDTFDDKAFNALMKNEKNSMEGRYKYNKRIQIKDGHLVEENLTGGGAKKHSIVKVGPKKDLKIQEITKTHVTFRMGTYTPMDEHKKIAPKFEGSGNITMPLVKLWAYLQSHNGRLESPKDKFPPPEQKPQTMSWFNIFLHAHSVGTLLHGDLWKGPWKAFDDQHKKDHEFAGKMTAALAIEKAQGSMGGVGSWLFDRDWANLMIGDSNSSFQSYLDELVNKLDSMGSFHRARIIKKWSRLHFPDPKFMAAMMASMKYFGNLYPYDDGDNDPRSSHGQRNWYWYNSMVDHSKVKRPAGYPDHMPTDEEDWPKDSGGNMITEAQACYELFGEFDHPLLKNLGRRFQKYMTAGHKDLFDGGKGNLEQRAGMYDRLNWMMDTVCHSKLTEAFGASNKIWLEEGYPTEITTMPYAALLFGNRDQQLMPSTQSHLKDEFNAGNHIPMFLFAQNKNLGDTFRNTGIAFAYTISPEAGAWLKELVDLTSETRYYKGLKTQTGVTWRKSFENFWLKHGAELMHKMTGMRDPMLNLMIKAPKVFDKMTADLPKEKQEEYKRLRDNKNIEKYYETIKGEYDDPKHAHMDRGKEFYTGNHFRFRDGFDSGFPIAWIAWDAYLDANLDTKYSGGSDATAGDGIYNEIRGFVDKIPEMSKKMVQQMGYDIKVKPGSTYVDEVAEKLFEKNIDPMRRLARQKIDITNPKAEYCSMHAAMMGIIDVKELKTGGAGGKEQERFAKYFDQMKETVAKADKMAKNEGYVASIIYREKMAKKWGEIIRTEHPTASMNIQDIENFGGGKKTHDTETQKTIEASHEKYLETLRNRKKNENPNKKEKNEAAKDNTLGLMG